jgi:CRISPR system Cascade subunit CasA
VTCRYSLLDEPLIRARLVADGEPRSYTLPGLFVALQADEVRDFPALRPHQRHPWHAFLVQLAAIAMHRAGTTEPFATDTAWRDALLALTPDDPDGAAWCLVSPPDRPGFMQPPVPGEAVEKWTNHLVAPDELDMLVTSKNHDLKAARMARSLPDDWMLALISLQTQDGAMGAPNKAISRVSSGYSCRCALGVAPKGEWGRRWRRDVAVLHEGRVEIIDMYGLKDDGIALVWMEPWNGNDMLSFGALDPFYIEVCRRIRLTLNSNGIIAHTSGSKKERIDAKDLKGVTGDPWIPVHVDKDPSALNVGISGFNYRLASKLVFGDGTYRQPLAQALREDDGKEGIVILAQGVARGQGKTEGYHERRIPLSRKARLFLRTEPDRLGKIAGERVSNIGDMQRVLKSALVILFDNGVTKQRGKEKETPSEKKAKFYSRNFEAQEDHLFFTDLNTEIEADDPDQARLDWLLAMKDRAETILKRALDAGPRCGEQRYRARAAALSRFERNLRGESSALPDLAQYYRDQKLQKETIDDNP